MEGRRRDSRNGVLIKTAGPMKLLAGYRFLRCAIIKPNRLPDGRFLTYRPQNRYKGAAYSRLHQYGSGSFCKFAIPGLPESAGVYLLCVKGRVMYIGHSQNLAERFSFANYGMISPKNCYQYGQSTNCKINKQVLRYAKKGQFITLWFHPTRDSAKLETELLSKVMSPWNRRGGNSPGQVATPW